MKSYDVVIGGSRISIEADTFIEGDHFVYFYKEVGGQRIIVDMLHRDSIFRMTPTVLEA